MILNNVRTGCDLRKIIIITLTISLLAGGVSAKVINDNATGGDCSSFGTWYAASKTCVMTVDLTEGITITSDNTTLDGSGHTVKGDVGVYDMSGVIIGSNVKNLVVVGSITAIYSSGMDISNNKIEGNIGVASLGYAYISNNNLTNGYIDISESSAYIINNKINSKEPFGIRLWRANADIINNIIISGGIQILRSSSAEITGNKFNSGGIEFNPQTWAYANITNNIINSTGTGISFNGLNPAAIVKGNTINSNVVISIGSGFGYMEKSQIFNNYLNGTIILPSSYPDPFLTPIWNTTKTPGSNIIGGIYFGGNYWANPGGTGFSQTCKDANKDGICDSIYVLNSNNTDFLPLASSPKVTDPAASHEIPDDTDNEPLWGETAQLNATVTDDSGIGSVTVDLSSIGGPAAKPMINIGGNIWSTTTNAVAGTPPNIYDLFLNATDNAGNSNTDVSIKLKIMKNGDTTGNGAVNIGDALLCANNVSFHGNPTYAMKSLYVAEVTGNGIINIGDCLRLANRVAFPGNPSYILK